MRGMPGLIFRQVSVNFNLCAVPGSIKHPRFDPVAYSPTSTGTPAPTPTPTGDTWME